MSATLVGAVSNQVQSFWSPNYTQQLKESTPLPALVSKDYQGEIRQGGDTVYVSQINRPTATRKTVGSNHETFETSQLSTSRISITANQVITAAYEFDNLVDLQSQIGEQKSTIRLGLLEATQIELNKYLYSLVAPSTSTPDHSIASVTDFNASQLATARMLAAQAKWRQEGGWWCLPDPSYYTDLLNSQTLTSSDYNGGDTPLVGGKMVKQRFGFNIVEDNSLGASCKPSFVTGSVDMALLFHPDFMHLVMQKEPEFEVSSTHSNKQHGYIISVRMVVGAALGVDGANKHIVVYNS
jgi:hypothetical protein